ncbi:MAG: Uma2 family endonuclease [Chloroflexota bacterium]|nr:Uma2 family endonuclease [Chloroflexota bacterium]
MLTQTETKRLTRADYRAFVEQPEHVGRVFEFIDGEIIEKVSGGNPSNLAATFIGLLFIYLRDHPIGHITSSDGEYDLPDGDTLIPDVGYISTARMAVLNDDAIPMQPDLAIEVQSKTDRKRAMRKKAEQYIENGTQMVWLVFLDKTAEVYTNNLDIEPLVFGLDGVLSGGEVLPGLSIALTDIFPA